MKKKTKMLAAFIAVLMMLVTAVPVTAATGTAYTPVQGTTTEFTKYLVMDDEANVPNVDFTFSVAAGQAADASERHLEVLAGVDADKVTLGVGEARDGKVPFTAGDATTAGAADDGIANDTAKKYASKTVTLDFSGCTFPKPGVYRYILTEKTASASEIANDSTPTRTVDVYVADKNDGSAALEIEGYVMYSGTVTAAPYDNTYDEDTENNLPAVTDTAAGTKSTSYINTYGTENLTLKKKVSGNQASRAEYFEFTVTLSGVNAGTVYTVDLTNAEAAPTVDGEEKTNAAVITVPDDATEVTAVYWLQGGQFVVIQGLATGTKYEIGENSETLNKEGYTTDITTDATAENGKDSDAVTTIDSDNRKIADTGTGLTTDIEITFTNSKNSVIPTGVIMKVAPFVIAGVVVIAAAAVLIVRAKRRDAEEEEEE